MTGNGERQGRAEEIVPRFLADSMVGKLARWLRLLGYDARYERRLDDAGLVQEAAREERIVLTRDRGLVERRACKHWLLLESDDPWQQLIEVIDAFDLPLDGGGWLSRCLECNVPLQRVPRTSVRDDVPPYVYAHHRRFARCPGCEQVYWRGTHVDDMRRRWRRLRPAAGRGGRGSTGSWPLPGGLAVVVMALGLAAAAPACSPAAGGFDAGLPEAGSRRIVDQGRQEGRQEQERGRDEEQEEDRFAAARARLVEELRTQGIEDEEVLEAIERVPRHRFVPRNLQEHAYANQPLPIGRGQTISQPYIVALMTELLDVEEGTKVLEIGTGSGYQAAVLAELGCDVYTIEIIEELALQAIQHLSQVGHREVDVRVGNGYLGWPEQAPFDRIIVTAAPEEIPEPLVEQLRVGGKMVIPVGPQWREQYLMLLEKRPDGTVQARRVLPVRFVPMVGDGEPGERP